MEILEVQTCRRLEHTLYILTTKNHMYEHFNNVLKLINEIKLGVFEVLIPNRHIVHKRINPANLKSKCSGIMAAVSF